MTAPWDAKIHSVLVELLILEFIIVDVIVNAVVDLMDGSRGWLAALTVLTAFRNHPLLLQI